MMFNNFWYFGAILSLLNTLIQSASLSNPYTTNGNISDIIPGYYESKSSKKAYHEATPKKVDNIKVIEHSDKCSIGFKLRWSTPLGSSALSTPVIFPTGPTGQKKIFQNTFYQYIEMISHDGFKPWGWPLSFDESSFQSSPLLYDLDNDGYNDIGSTDKNGNLYWIRVGDYGQYLSDYHIVIPTLKIRKDWYISMDSKEMDKIVMNSMFDHYNRYDIYSNTEYDNIHIKKESKGKTDQLLTVTVPTTKKKDSTTGDSQDNMGGNNIGNTENTRRRLTEVISNKENIITDTTHTTTGISSSSNIDSSSTSSSSVGSSIDSHIHDSFKSETKSEDNSEFFKSDILSHGRNIIEGENNQILIPEESHVDSFNHTIVTAQTISSVAISGISHTPIITQIHPSVDGSLSISTTSPTTISITTTTTNSNMKESVYVSLLPTISVTSGVTHSKHTHDSSSSISDKENNNNNHNNNNNNNGHDQVESAMPSIMNEYQQEANTTTIGDRMNDFPSVFGTEYSYQGHLDDFVPSSKYRYGGGGDNFKAFDDGFRYYGAHNYFNDSDYIYVDAHVLNSPVLIDKAEDGYAEIYVAISYYFDKTKYSGPNMDFDPDMYIAGGLGCWNVKEQIWSWLVHLDLTTDKTQFKALIHSSPTLADLDGDGAYEVIIGTSLGLLYVLDSNSGLVKRFFPMQFHEIQAQIAVADIYGGTHLEMIIADMGGNICVVTLDGDIIWDQQLSGTLPHTPTIGDIDGDGQLDVAIVSVDEHGESHVYALRGDTGEILPGFPVALPKSSVATSPILLADLHTYTEKELIEHYKWSTFDPYVPIWTYNTEGHLAEATNINLDFELNINMETSRRHMHPVSNQTSHMSPSSSFSSHKNKLNRGLHLILSTYNGHVFIIDGKTQCTERIDVGEHLYSMPLLDDVTGDGYLDLVVNTVNGQMILLESSVPYHPLSAYTSFPRSRLNGFTYGQMGISVPLYERERLLRSDTLSDRLDLSKNEVTVVFDIFDTRIVTGTGGEGDNNNSNKEDVTSSPRRYWVTFSRSTNKANALLTVEYTRPGRYQVKLPISPPEEMLLIISMRTEHGLYFEDSLPVSIGTKFYVWIKYLVAAPVVLLCLPLLLYRP